MAQRPVLRDPTEHPATRSMSRRSLRNGGMPRRLWVSFPNDAGQVYGIVHLMPFVHMHCVCCSHQMICLRHVSVRSPTPPQTPLSCIAEFNGVDGIRSCRHLGIRWDLAIEVSDAEHLPHCGCYWLPKPGIHAAAFQQTRLLFLHG